MDFGRLINGTLIRNPAPLQVGDRVHSHPSPELYAQAGYLPIVDTPQPEQGEPTRYYAAHYEAQGGQIVRVWTEAEPSPPAPPTMGERMDKLERLAATINEIGVTKSVESSDKEGSDWVVYRVGGVVVRRDYVPCKEE